MPKVKLLTPGRWGEKQNRDYSYSMVMEVDGRVELRSWYRRGFAANVP
jgi:hypothetical protein